MEGHARVHCALGWRTRHLASACTKMLPPLDTYDSAAFMSQYIPLVHE